LVVFTIQPVVLSVFNKNNLKKIYVRSGKERITQTDLYWFTLTPKATSSPQKPLGKTLCNQNQITHYLWQITPRVLILNTSRTHNTLWQHQYRNTVIKEEGNKIHLGITKLKVQNYNSIIFHALKNDPKLFQILKKLFLINSFSYSKIGSVKPPLHGPTKWSKKFNKGVKLVRII